MCTRTVRIAIALTALLWTCALLAYVHLVQLHVVPSAAACISAEGRMLPPSTRAFIVTGDRWLWEIALLATALAVFAAINTRAKGLRTGFVLLMVLFALQVGVTWATYRLAKAQAECTLREQPLRTGG